MVLKACEGIFTTYLKPEQILSWEICPNLQIRGFSVEVPYLLSVETFCKYCAKLCKNCSQFVQILCNFANRLILSANGICKWSVDNWNWRRPFLPAPTHHKILIPIYGHVRVYTCIYRYIRVNTVIYGHIRTGIYRLSYTPTTNHSSTLDIDWLIRAYTLANFSLSTKLDID